MAYTGLTESGKNFIRRICNGSGNSLLRGKSQYSIDDSSSKYYNPNGILPFCDPITLPSKIWISNAEYNGNLITTNQQLGEALIYWYNKYGEIYQMNANVMAAQAYHESGYNVWNYALTSTASGIGQFTIEALFDIAINSPDRINIIIPTFPKISDDEINLIINGIYGITLKNSKYTYLVSTEYGKKNRPIIHQNITDNPEIMIKAQYRYMKYIANKYNLLASNVLFGYSRGPGYIKEKYYESINACINDKEKKRGYENEGIDYVYKIFKTLENEFGYKLGMSDPPTVDNFTANIG